MERIGVVGLSWRQGGPRALARFSVPLEEREAEGLAVLPALLAHEVSGLVRGEGPVMDLVLGGWRHDGLGQLVGEDESGGERDAADGLRLLILLPA